MGPQAEDYIETVLTCEGDFYDPEFHSQLVAFSEKLGEILLEDKNKNLIIKKVEPWNSVKVTFNIPKDAAVRLRCLAEEGDEKLKKLGILSVEIEGDRKISLRIAGKNNETTELIFNTPDPSIFDLNSSDDTPPPKSVENTSKNIAHYLGQQSVPQESSGSSVMDTINHVASGLSASSPSGMFEQPSVSVARKASHAFLPEAFASQAQTQISPKFPTPPPSVSTPSSPGSKQPTNFPHPQMPHSNPFGSSQAAVNNMVSKLFGGQNASGTSPLLVNLLQNDAIAAAAAAAAMASGTLNAQTMNRLVGLPPPDGPPPKKKRKPRKPKDKEAKDVKKVKKSDKETESAIHHILNQAMAEGGVQDRVPPVGTESSSFADRPLTPSQRASPAAYNSEATSSLSKSPHSHLRSPVRHNIGGMASGQRQIINPSTGQLELVDDESGYFNPALSEAGGIPPHQKPTFRLSHSPSVPTPPSLHQHTQVDKGVMSNVYNRTSPVVAPPESSGMLNPHYRDPMMLLTKPTMQDQTVKPSPNLGHRKSPLSSVIPKHTPHSSPHAISKLNHPSGQVPVKPSCEATAQSNSAIMPVVSNIAFSAGSHLQSKSNVSMQQQSFVRTQPIVSSQLQNQMPPPGNQTIAQPTVTALTTSTVDSLIAQLHQTTSQKPTESISFPSISNVGQIGISLAPSTSSVQLFPEQIISSHSVINSSASVASSFTPRDKVVTHTQGIHGTSSASNTPSHIPTNINSDISKRIETSSLESVLSAPIESVSKPTEPVATSVGPSEQTKTVALGNHVDAMNDSHSQPESTEPVKSDTSLPNVSKADISQNHSSESITHPIIVAHNNELSNNSCDDPTKHGSVDSGLGDIKENNGESPCGSSGNDSPGTAAVSRGLTVASNPAKDKKLSQISDRNILTVGYVLNDGVSLTEPSKNSFTSKATADRMCTLPLISKQNPQIQTKDATNLLDAVPDLVKIGSTKTLDIKQVNKTTTPEPAKPSPQLGQDHIKKSLNLMGRSDLNPGGGGGESNLDTLLLNGDDHSLHLDSTTKVVTSMKPASVNCNEETQNSGGREQSTASVSTGRTDVPHKPTNKPKSTETHKAIPNAVRVSTPSVSSTPSLDTLKTGSTSTKSQGSVLPVTTITGTMKINCSVTNSMPSSTIVTHTSVTTSVVSSFPVSNGSASSSKITEKVELKPPTTVSAGINPLLLHGVLGNNVMLNPQALKSKGILPQANGPINMHAFSSGSPFNAVSSTIVNASNFLDIPNLLSKSITSVAAAESAIKKDPSLVLKKRAKTPDALFAPNKLTPDRNVLDVAKAVPSYAPPPPLTTVAPSIGHIPMRSPLKTSPSPSKMNTGMASLGPSPIMSTGLPYFNTPVPTQVTPPPPEAAKTAQKTGISISGEEDSLNSPVKDLVGRKSPKTTENPEKLAGSSKRAQLTVQQILEQSAKDALPVLNPNIIPDGSENLNQIPPIAKSATVALQQIAKQRDIQRELKEHIAVGSVDTSVPHAVSKLTSNEDLLLASSGIHVPNLVANPVNASSKMITAVVSHPSNMTITAPGFHKNLTESVQKVMNVFNSNEVTVHQSVPNQLTTNDSAKDPRKSPIAKAMPKINSTRPDSSVDDILGKKPSGANLLIASAEAKMNIQDGHKEKHLNVSNSNSAPVATSLPKLSHVAIKMPTPTITISSSDNVKPSVPSVSSVNLSEHSYSSPEKSVKEEIKPNAVVKSNGNNNESVKKQTESGVGVSSKDPPVSSTVSARNLNRDLKVVSTTSSVSIAFVTAKAGQVQSMNVEKTPFVDQSNHVQIKKESGKIDGRDLNKTKEPIVKTSVPNKVNDLKSHMASEKSDSKHSIKVPLTTTITTTKETSKPIVIKSDVKETTNFSLDLRSAVTAGSSSKFIKIEAKDWRERQSAKAGSNVAFKSKTSDVKTESIKQETAPPETNAVNISTRRPSANSETSNKLNDVKTEDDVNEETTESTKESTAQKVTRASKRHSSETPEVDTAPKPAARIKRRGSRGSNESKASSVDGGRIEESPPCKMNTRGRNKTTSESSENQDPVHSRRGSNAGSRDRSSSPTVHNTRTSRQTRKKVLDVAQETVDVKPDPPTPATPNEQCPTRATRSSKRKLPASEEKETNNTEHKKSKTETHDATEPVVRVATRADSAEPDAKPKGAAKPRAAKSKAANAPNEAAVVSSDTSPMEEKGGEGSSRSTRSTRSTRSHDHCELPNSFAKKKQKLS